MKISKNYSRNVNLGNYETARVGITLDKEIENPSKEKVEKISKSLLNLCKKLVHEELKQIKKEVENERRGN